MGGSRLDNAFFNLGVCNFEDTEFPLENKRHRISGHVRGSENAFLMCFFGRFVGLYV